MRSPAPLVAFGLASISLAMSRAPRMTARSSSAASTVRRSGKPDFCTRPPSSMRRRVRARRSCIQARVSVRARAASARRMAAVVRRSAAAVVSHSRMSVAGAVRLCPSFTAKEALAFALPRLLCTRIGLGALDRLEECAGQRFRIERIGAGSSDEFAELDDAAGTQLLLLVMKGFEFGVDVARFAHAVWSSLRVGWGYMTALQTSIMSLYEVS